LRLFTIELVFAPLTFFEATLSEIQGVSFFISSGLSAAYLASH